MAAGGSWRFLIELVSDASKAVKDFNAAEKSLKKIRQQLKGSDKEFDVFSTGVWGTAAAVQAWTAGMVWQGAKVEDAMATTGSSLEYAGSSASEMGHMFLDAGKDAAALLPVAEYAAKLGMKGAPELMEFTNVAQTMGAAFGISAQQAGDSLAKLGAATGKGTKDLALLASGMAALENRALVSRGALEMVVLRTADVAKAAGVSEAPIMALAAAFEQKGIKARMAIQPISKMVELLGKGRIPGIKLARAIGLSGEKLEAWKKMKPEERMALFTSELAKMKPEKAAKKLEALKISSGRYAKQIVGALQDTKKFNEMMGIAAAGMADTTELEKNAEERKATLTAQVGKLWTSLKALGQEIGLVLIPAVTLVVRGLNLLVQVLNYVPAPILAVLVGVGWLISSLVLLSKIMMASFVIQTLKSVSSLLILAAAQLGVTGATKLQTKATYKNAMAQIAATKATWAQFIASLRLIPAIMKTIVVLVAEKIAHIASTVWKWKWVAAAWAEVTANWALTAAQIKSTFWTVVGTIKTVALTIAQWACVAATAALSLAQGALAGVIGLASAAFGFLIPIIWGAVTALWAMAIPILIIAAKVILVIAIIVALVIAVKLITDWMMTWSSTAKKVFLAIGWLISPIVWLVFAIRLLVKHWDEVVAAMGRVWDTIKSLWASFGWLLGPIGTIIWLIQKLVKLLAGSGLEEAIGIVRGAFQKLIGIVRIVQTAILNFIMAPFKMLSNLTTRILSMGSAIGEFVWKILNPLNVLKFVFQSLAKVVAFVKGLLFGSSFLHIFEGVMGVLPSLDKLRGKFELLAQSIRNARGVPPVPTVSFAPAAKAIGETIAARTAAPKAAAPERAAAAAAAEPAAAGRAGGGGEVRIVIPVSVELDGMILTRVVAEHLTEIGLERGMKESAFPLRGVEPAY